MAVDSQRVQAVFLLAVQAADAGARAGTLERECGGDAELRRCVEALLQAHDASGSFPDRPLLGPTIDMPGMTEGPGSRIGTYRLLQQIGKGGMGVVFLAEQTQPVQRKVALKIIKPGMDSRQVIARLEAERQALALMDHPNIAKVFDAGATDTGRPYFVMELVKGVPITKYCDEHRLTPRQRLELFVPVCQAVQHAHQKGIIHRDLKPSNVLIALYDGQPVPKVIDFGVAKASGQKLTDKTLFTGFGAVVGTLEYMSPEQAGLNQLDIDTRSDIYALGVLLYELLTGTTPHPRKQLREAALLEGLRIIREEEPPRPSLRLSTTEELPSIAARRSLEPKKLSGLLRGELDWIVMKCLDKDRNRRYETANALAMDVERYLADEPVLACPPSLSYRLRKFAGRHRGPLRTAAIILLVLLASAGAVGWVQWDRSRQQARQQAELEEGLEAALQKVRELRQQSRWAEARAVLEQTRDRLTAGPEELRERVQLALADWALVDRLRDIRLKRSKVVEGEVDSRTAEQEYAATLRNAGLGIEGDAPKTVAARLGGTTVADQLVAAIDDWAAITEKEPRRAWLLDVARRADPNAWRDRFRNPRVWQSRERLAELAKELLDDGKLLAGQSPELLNALAVALARREADRLPLLAAAQQRYPDDFWLSFSLGRALYEAKRLHEAVPIFRAAIAIYPSAAMAHNSLGVAFLDQDQVEDAAQEYRLAVTLDPTFAAPHSNLADIFMKKGQLDAAIPEYRHAIELDRKGVLAYRKLGQALLEKKQPADAAAAFRQAIDLDPKEVPTHAALGRALLRLERYAEAADATRRCLDLLHTNDSKRAPYIQQLCECGRRLWDSGRQTEASAILCDCLRADLRHWSAQMPFDKAGVRAALGRWQADPGLTPLRDAAVRATLPKAESEACRQLWQELTALSARAGERLVLVADGPKVRGPTALDLDREGNLYYTDWSGHQVWKIDARGAISRIAGTGTRGSGGDGGPATKAALNGPQGILVAANGDLLVADSVNHCVRKIDAKTGIITTIAGTIGKPGFDGDGGPAVRALFKDITSLAFDAKREKLYLSDNDNSRVRMIDLASGIVATVAGNGQKGVPRDGDDAKKAPLIAPRAIALDASGNLYIADIWGHALRVVDREGRIRTLAGNGKPGQSGDGGPAKNATLDRTEHVCVEPDGNVLVANATSIRRYLPRQGTIVRVAGTNSAGAAGLNGPPELAQLRWPRGLALGPSGTIYVADTDNNRIVKIEQDPQEKLNEILSGQAKDAAELMRLARFASHQRGWYARSAAILKDRFQAHPDWAESRVPPQPNGLKFTNRRFAAAAAAMAAAGRGDGSVLKEEQRAAWRRQALVWMAAEVATWKKHLEARTPEVLAEIVPLLNDAVRDGWLAGIRDPQALAKLPAEERQAWEQLWADVAELRRTAAAKK